MLKFGASLPAAAIVNDLKSFQKQLTFATAKALTKTAQEVTAEDKREISKVFDRPTPYALNSLFLKPATKQNLEARVWIKSDVFKGTPAENFLKPQIDGGIRKQKRFERALINSGLMPQGYYVVPGTGITLDQYGNIPSRVIVQLLSYFRAFGQQGYKANMDDSGRRRYDKKASKLVGQSVSYFISTGKGKLLPGIYQRIMFSSGSAIKPILIFVKSVGYKKRFNFYETSKAVIDKRYKQNLDDSINAAIATAR